VELIFTSAMATASFLHEQYPGGTAYIIGESGIITALVEVGYTLDESSSDYVVLGETFSYSFERIATAIRMIASGSRFIATNPDVVGPSEKGLEPACGAVAAMITAATNVQPYIVGKPNPYMIRTALRRLGVHSENTIIIGDRMDTDIVGGIESGMETILVLSGVTKRGDVKAYPYRPGRIVASVAEIE
jgi:5'-nucleotidase